MNNLNGSNAKSWLICILCILCSFTLWSYGPSVAGNDHFSAFPNNTTDDIFKMRATSMQTIVDIEYDKRVQSYIKSYMQNGKHHSQIMLGRKELYFPMFEEALRRKGLPDDLKYLSVVESSLNPRAKSPTGAAGLWQFMKGTAKQYGLRVDHIVDERYDPVKSTEAALNYLSDLYEKFDDWNLALSAYNSGPGRVGKSIRKANSYSYPSVVQYLPKETRNYLPNFIAVSYLFNYYALHDLQPKYPNSTFKQQQLIKLYDKESFSSIAERFGCNYKIIALLNPSYLQKYVPKSDQGNNILIPLYGKAKQRIEADIKPIVLKEPSFEGTLGLHKFDYTGFSDLQTELSENGIKEKDLISWNGKQKITDFEIGEVVFYYKMEEILGVEPKEKKLEVVPSRNKVLPTIPLKRQAAAVFDIASNQQDVDDLIMPEVQYDVATKHETKKIEKIKSQMITGLKSVF